MEKVIENDSESYTLGIDANTGRNLWKMDRPKAANWTSPLVWQADKNSADAIDRLRAVALETGVLKKASFKLLSAAN